MHTSTIAAAALLAAGPVFTAGHAAAQDRYVLYVFDQSPDRIVRLQDRNSDGDYNDARESSVFYDDTPPPDLGLDNSQSMVMLGFDHMYAVDNFAPDNMVELIDLNGDGDAFDPGEAAVAFAGLLPTGLTMTNPAHLIPVNPNAGTGLLLLDNNTLDDTRPEAVYHMEDLNTDGDFDDAGEVVQLIELSPVGDSFNTTILDIAQDNAGIVYGIDIATPDDNPSNIESIDRIDTGTGQVSELLSSFDAFSIFGVFIAFTQTTIRHDPATDELLVELLDLGNNPTLWAFRDADGSGTINSPAEGRLLWSETGNADGVSGGTVRDIAITADGSVFTLDNLADTVRRHRDLNGDGDFQDLGETAIVYDAAIAGANGGVALNLLLTLAATPDTGCGNTADTNNDGVIDGSDFFAWVAAFGNNDPECDVNLDGACDGGDFFAWVAGFAQGCA